jgi:D-alanine-D-alanine ligase
VKKKLGVIIGGKSSEHDISLRSGFGVISNLDRQKYEIYVVIIDKDGRWYLYFGDNKRILDASWKDDKENLKCVAITSDGCSFALSIDGEPIKLDVVFPVLHGANGEDGRLQGLLELVGTPFVGCKTTSSAVCMDKDITNCILQRNGILVPPWIVCRKKDKKSLVELQAELERVLSYPVFVKPANSGSSLGVSKLSSASELDAAVALAFRADDKILIQQGVSGREVQCAVLGNDELIASVPSEAVPCNEFYDYEAKYLKKSGLHIPARINPVAIEAVREGAKRAFSALGCSGMARVDGFVDDAGKIWIIEVNTIPGFTEISQYPKLMKEMGIGYVELLDRLIALACEGQRW